MQTPAEHRSLQQANWKLISDINDDIVALKQNDGRKMTKGSTPENKQITKISI